MLTKCVLIFFLSTIPISFIEAVNMYSQSCPPPRIQNGRVRIRHRAKLVKFTCLPRYELVGNRYATCMNGVWDVPMPVCVRSGCPELTGPENGVQLKNHQDAWVVTFCLPGYKLLGSPIIYCNGFKWNGTAPKCIDTSIQVESDAKCNFDDPLDPLCGWIQDELHDFDWRRWNRKTPSFFMRTGPSFDHTLGDGKNGYYMYLEGTGVDESKTARLLSPVIDAKMAADGCFSFFYHMYGRNMGGFLVYQKPDSLQLVDLLKVPVEDRGNYTLFEQWGAQGDKWIGAAPPLINFNEDFQIVIEGIQGKSYFNDMAFDDVAILRGENCTKFRASLSPSVNSQSCQNRCSVEDHSSPTDCKCSPSCEISSTCCEDYFEQCIWNNNNGAMTTEADEVTSAKPQTEKLIFSTTSSTTTTTTTPPPTTTSTTTTTTTTTPPPTTTSTTTKRPTTSSTTKPPTKAYTQTTAKATTTKRPVVLTTVKPTTKKLITTTKTIKTTPQTTTIKTTTSTTTQRTTKLLSTVTTMRPIVVNMTTKDYSEIDREKSLKETQIQAIIKPKEEQKKSSTLKTTIITIVVLAILATLTYFAVTLSSSRGWISMARWRGRATHDPEVRYLNSSDDDHL